MRVLTVYSKSDCHLCLQAIAVLRRLGPELGFALVVCDIAHDEALHRVYFERIPVVTLDGEELFDGFVDEEILWEKLGPTHRPR